MEIKIESFVTTPYLENHPKNSKLVYGTSALQSYECECFTIIVSDSAINFYGFHYNEK